MSSLAFAINGIFTILGILALIGAFGWVILFFIKLLPKFIWIGILIVGVILLIIGTSI